LAEELNFSTSLKKKQKALAMRRDEYPTSVYVHEKTCNILADRIANVKRTFSNVLDIGSSATAGTIAYEIAVNADKHVQNLTLTSDSEMSKEIIKFNLKYFADAIEQVYPGEERFPKIAPIIDLKDEELDLENREKFPSDHYDLVIVSSGLHWCNDLDKVLTDIYRILREDGAILIALPGSETIAELRSAMSLAEQERNGRVINRCSPLTTGTDLSALLVNAKFKLVTCDVERLTVKYPTALELIMDLQQSGEQNAANDRKPWSYDSLLATLAIYQSMYKTKASENVKFMGSIQTSEDSTEDIGKHFSQSVEFDQPSFHAKATGNAQILSTDNSVQATFDIIHGIAWKPHHSQQKPAQRGSAKRGFNFKKDN